MNCQDYERLIYLRHECNEAERNGLASHLDACESCRAVLLNLTSTESRIREVFPAHSPEFPGALRTRIMAQIERERDHELPLLRQLVARLSVSFRYALGAVSLMLAIFFISEHTQVQQQPTPKPLQTGYPFTVQSGDISVQRPKTPSRDWAARKQLLINKYSMR